MNRIFYGVFALLFLAFTTYAADRAVNACKSTRLNTTSVLVSCQDEREPVITRLSETSTAVIVTCKVR
jgi:hypothetical protein